MNTPEKYKSIPYTEIINRTIIPVNQTKKENIQTTIQKFIQYLKNKHL